MNWPTVSRRGREVTRISNEGVIKADIRIQKKKKRSVKAKPLPANLRVNCEFFFTYN